MAQLVKREDYGHVERAIHDQYYDTTWGHGGLQETYDNVKFQTGHTGMKITRAQVKDCLDKQKIKIDKKPIQHNSCSPGASAGVSS